MNENIHNYALNVQLSFAAYADFENIDPLNFNAFFFQLTSKDLLDPPMSEAQALSFLGLKRLEDGSLELVEGTWFELIHHQPNTPSGFSATVFRNRETGEYHFAIRGTTITDIGDLINDVNAVLSGGADDQIISMLNYYMQLITPTNDMATQVVPIVTEEGTTYTTTTVNGLGKLDPTTPLNVTGHSLGGHLADAFIKAFPIIGNTATEAYTYNGLGVGSGLDNLLNQVANLYGKKGSESFNLMEG